MKIATWNVNSIKMRLPQLLEWLKRDAPDIVLLQETKCVNEAFPAMEIEELGYNLALHGEKTYNGVAILSKFPLEDIRRGLPGDDGDTQARYIEAICSIPSLRGSEATAAIQNVATNWIASSAMPPRNDEYITIRVASVYVPNGQDVESSKFQYKLRFLDRLYAHIKTLLPYEEILAIGGDYNIAPEDADVHDPKLWQGSVLTHDEVRRRLRRILWLGMYDAFRVASGEWLVARKSSFDTLTTHHSPLATTPYTWWDYRGNAFAQDNGLRIDHLLLSPQAADRLGGCTIEKNMRGVEKASDHTPVVTELNL